MAEQNFARAVLLSYYESMTVFSLLRRSGVRALQKVLAIAERVPVFKLLLPVYICLAIVFVLLIRHGHMQLLDPAGYISGIQSRILWSALILAGVASMIIIVTVFTIVFRYKEGSGRKYEPSWKAGKRVLTIAWALPTAVIAILSIFLWNTAHMVDPYKPISSTASPITIQVVALRWKWLFLYPNDRIASVNMLEIPVNTPVDLELTADAPMNSFWVPRLSGQIYAMTGMITQLHLEATQSGNYPGSPAEMSGDGFAGMTFTVKAVSAHDYQTWKTTTKHTTGQILDYASYTQLAKPSSYNPPALYLAPDPNLFDEIVMQFMAPGATPSDLQVRGTSL